MSSILPRQQVSYTDESLGAAVEIDPTYVTAWQKGILVFHDEPLGRVIEEVNRYWSGWIVVTNENLKSHLVTARFKLNHLGKCHYLGSVGLPCQCYPAF